MSLSLLKDSEETVLLPVLQSSLSQLDLLSLGAIVSSDSACEIVWNQVNKAEFYLKALSTVRRFCCYLPPVLLVNGLCLPQCPVRSKKGRGQTRGNNKVEKILQELLEDHGEGWTEELRRDLPRNFQRHGDLVLLGNSCFSLPQWKKIGVTVRIFKITLSLKIKPFNDCLFFFRP